MKSRLLFVSLCTLLVWQCEPTVYCDLAFHSVGFTWTDSSTIPSRVIPVVDETGDSLANDFIAISPAFTVVSDQHQSYFLNKTYHVTVYVLDSAGNILTDSQYVITADACHIQKVSGPEYLP